MSHDKIGKRYSIKDHKFIIEKKYKKAESIKDFTLGKGDFYYIDSLASFIAALDNKPILVINAMVFKINCNIPSIFEYKEGGILKNILSGHEIDIKNNIIYKSGNVLNFTIDTSLLRKFYLNKTTINHFSRIISTKDKTFYYIKRKNFSLVVSA